MDTKPEPRREKNRRHLVTLVTAVFGALIVVGLYFAYPQSRWISMLTAFFYVFVLLGRTIVIESGFRRR